MNTQDQLDQVVRGIVSDPEVTLTLVIQALASYMSEGELDDLRRWITIEAMPAIKRREAVTEAVAEERVKTIETMKEQLPAEALEVDNQPRPWQQFNPSEPATWFMYGDKAIDANGKVWISQVDPEGKQPNGTEPGAPGVDARYWIPESEIPDLEPVPEAIPWGDMIEYRAGQIVNYRGKLFEVLADHTASNRAAPDINTEHYQAL